MLTRAQIIEKLKDILVFADPKNTEAIEKADESANLSADLGFSSVAILYMAIAVEEAFSIEFDNVTTNDFNTLSDVVDFIEAKLG